MITEFKAPIAIAKALLCISLGMAVVSAPGRAAPGRASYKIAYIAGSTQKVCQLTGDFDKQLNGPTLSQTNKRFGVLATDLGSSFEHKGKLFFLCGDTWGQPGDADAIAWTTSLDPARIQLDFYHKNGKWQPPIVPGVRLGAFEIPSGGISLGGRMFVVFTTDWNAEKQLMGRSVLAVSDNDGQTFQVLGELSRDKFINVSFCVAGDWLYIFSSGAYRKSSVYLARVPAKGLGRAPLQYLRGFDARQKPQWSLQENEAISLFQHNVVGEFSVAYCKPLRSFIMLYNSGQPRGIVMRSAALPWGSWSEAEIIFEPWRDGGYGRFMHVSSNFKTAAPDTLSDPRREVEWGGEYGPYLMARYSKAIPNGCRIFYTMSTWNPYQVVVMQSDLKMQRATQGTNTRR